MVESFSYTFTCDLETNPDSTPVHPSSTSNLMPTFLNQKKCRDACVCFYLRLFPGIPRGAALSLTESCIIRQRLIST